MRTAACVRDARETRMYMHRGPSACGRGKRPWAIIAPRQSLIIIPDTLLSAPSYGIAAFCARPLPSGCYSPPFSSSSLSVARAHEKCLSVPDPRKLSRESRVIFSARFSREIWLFIYFKLHTNKFQRATITLRSTTEKITRECEILSTL